MAKNLKFVPLFLILSMILSGPVFPYWVWSPDQGKFVNPQKDVENAAEEQFNFSMQFYQGKNYKRAEDEFRNLIKQFPKSDASAEALFYLGQIHELGGLYYKAFKDYQKIVADFPQSERVDEVVERQFRIGDLFMTGKKEKLLGLPIKPSLAHAIEIFQKIVETSPYSAYGDQAQFRLAQAYRAKRDWKRAGEEYQKLIDNYPDSNLVDDAKFQMAECIALQAARPDRDQRGLEIAAQNFDEFLKEFPTSPIAQKAAKLKEVINLKAAEKNFKIGEYYEKDHYFESALIYYEDVVRAYPGTDWAKRAEDRILKLRQPEKFLHERAGQIEAKQRDLAARERAIAEKERGLRYEKNPELEKTVNEEKQKIKELKKSISEEASRFEQNKKESVKLRRRALDRDKAELHRKEKVLAEKRKLLRKNPSQDLERALERWADSLEAERYSLYRQETDLVKLEEQFGLRHVPRGILGFLPFAGRRQTLDTMIQYKYKDFVQLTEKWHQIQEEKAKLFNKQKEYEMRLVSAGPWNMEALKRNEEIWKQVQAENPSWVRLEQAINQKEEELAKLTEKRDDLEKQIKKLSGSLITKVGGVVTAPVTLAAVPAEFVGGALGQLNPFKPGAALTESEQFVELLREKEKLEKRIEKTKGIIQTIQTAFEEELASDIIESGQGEKAETLKVEANRVVSRETEETVASAPAPLTEAQRKERIELKKRIKQVEREIRRRYEEIEDRKEDKSKKLDELAQLFRERRNRGLLGPVGGTAKSLANTVRIFFFGMKNEERAMSKKAQKIQGEAGEEGARAAELRESIELDNIMIEARGREIEALRQDLDLLKAKAETLEGFQFRSILIERPGNAIGETIEEASKIIPKKDKKSVLIHRLDSETRALADLEGKWGEMDEKIKAKTLEAQAAEKKALEARVTVPEVPTPAPFSVPAPPLQAPSPISSRTPTVSQAESAPVSPQAKLTQELNDLDLLIANKNQRILDERAALERELGTWAGTHNLEMPGLGGREKKKIDKSRKKIDRELKDLSKDLGKLLKEEKETLEREHALYREKLEQLDKAIANMKKRADDRYELLVQEKETVSRRLEQTAKALSSLASSDEVSTVRAGK